MKNRVRILREKEGLSIVDFAQRCEVSRQTIHSIENGVYKPIVILAIKMAKTLRVTVEELFILEKGD
jgi:putative transcriptional regulator